MPLASSPISSCPTQTKTARETPAPLTSLKSGDVRSALADQRHHRGRGRRWLVEVPAYAELDVVGGDVLQRKAAAVHDRDAVEGVGRAGNRATEIHVAVGQFDREVVGDVVGKTGVDRPGQIPFAGIAGE